MSTSSGIPGWFIAVFVLVLLLGIGLTIWRVTTARKMAQDAGLDPGTATRVSLLSNNGLDAAYIASSMRSHSQPQQPDPAQPVRSTEQRLEELAALKAKNLITDSEYESRRKDILDSL